jgi:hypothetical protein
LAASSSSVEISGTPPPERLAPEKDIRLVRSNLKKAGKEFARLTPPRKPSEEEF